MLTNVWVSQKLGTDHRNIAILCNFSYKHHSKQLNNTISGYPDPKHTRVKHVTHLWLDNVYDWVMTTNHQHIKWISHQNLTYIPHIKILRTVSNQHLFLLVLHMSYHVVDMSYCSICSSVLCKKACAQNHHIQWHISHIVRQNPLEATPYKTFPHEARPSTLLTSNIGTLSQQWFGTWKTNSCLVWNQNGRHKTMADDVLYIRVSTVSAPEVTHPPHWHHHPDNPHEKRQTTQHLIIMRVKKVIVTATAIVIVVMMMMMAACYMFTNPFSPRNFKASPPACRKLTKRLRLTFRESKRIGE